MALLVEGCITAGQGRQQGEIGFATAAESRGLGRLQGLTHEMKGLEGRIRLPEQNQPGHLVARRQIQTHGVAWMRFRKLEQSGLVLGPTHRVDEKVR